MVSRLNPYISFKDNARQAMDFYREVFGGELNVMTFAELGAAQGDAAEANLVMHSQLNTPSGFTLMASDTPDTMGEHGPISSMTVSLSGDDGAELRDYFAKLSDGGTVTMPLDKQVWGDEFGMCVDKFGVPWMVNISAPTVA
jgi:PhnB protein